MTPRSEKSIEADIIRALRDMGFLVTKTSQPRPSMITRGVPDLFAAHPRWGLQLWVEVKRADGQPTAHQRAWHATVRMAGGNVLVARSVADVVTELGRLGAPIRVAS
jgi:hypothetical protein